MHQLRASGGRAAAGWRIQPVSIGKGHAWKEGSSQKKHLNWVLKVRRGWSSKIERWGLWGKQPYSCLLREWHIWAGKQNLRKENPWGDVSPSRVSSAPTSFIVI